MPFRFVKYGLTLCVFAAFLCGCVISESPFISVDSADRPFGKHMHFQQIKLDPISNKWTETTDAAVNLDKDGNYDFILRGDPKHYGFLMKQIRLDGQNGKEFYLLQVVSLTRFYAVATVETSGLLSKKTVVTVYNLDLDCDAFALEKRGGDCLVKDPGTLVAALNRIDWAAADPDTKYVVMDD